jgi:adenosine deaminase
MIAPRAQALQDHAMASDFQEALAAGDLDGLRRAPKADLHNHAILGGDREFLAARTGRRIEPLRQPLPDMAAMHAWVSEAVGDLFDGRAGRLLGFEAALVQARRDGVTRLEIGEDVWAITLWDGSAESLTADLKAVHAAVAPEIAWSPELGLSRHCPVPALDRWLSPFLELGVWRALDLSGDEFAQPIEAFQPLFRKAKAAGLRLKAHVGEWGSAEDVRRAVELLDLDEVQHGIAAAASPEVMRVLAERCVRLNICPTSNLMLSRVESLEAHPIRRLYDAGVRVSVNTDDVLVFGAALSDEFLKLYEAGVFSAAELDALRLDALAD